MCGNGEEPIYRVQSSQRISCVFSLEDKVKDESEGQGSTGVGGVKVRGSKF